MQHVAQFSRSAKKRKIRNLSENEQKLQLSGSGFPGEFGLTQEGTARPRTAYFPTVGFYPALICHRLPILNFFETRLAGIAMPVYQGWAPSGS